MIQEFIFGGERSDKRSGSSPNKTLLLEEMQPDMTRGLLVREVFVHFQNLNLRVLIEDLRRGQVTRGSWAFADDLCPVAHGLGSGQAVSVLRYLSQAVDLPRACRRAAEEMGVPPRFIERFILSWDGGGMSREWLLDQLEDIWYERQADADAVQRVIGAEPVTLSAARDPQA
jgi:hypothetical protein